MGKEKTKKTPHHESEFQAEGKVSKRKKCRGRLEHVLEWRGQPLKKGWSKLQNYGIALCPTIAMGSGEPLPSLERRGKLEPIGSIARAPSCGRPAS